VEKSLLSVRLKMKTLKISGKSKEVISIIALLQNLD